MSVSIQATCTACLSIVNLKVEAGQKEIVCPACAHTQPNLSDEDLRRMAATQRQQCIFGLAALASFALGTLFFLLWVFQSPGTSSNTLLAILAFLLCAAAAVLGGLSTRTRYVMEF